LTAAGDRGAEALRTITSRLGIDRLLNGGWFRKLAIEHIRNHNAKVSGAHWDTVYPGLDVEQRAEREIQKVCWRASIAGILASTGASTGELVSLISQGASAPIGVPAAVLSMCGEAAYTTFLQIDLACDLGSIYGVPFDVDDIGDLTTLFGLALELPPPPKKSAQAEEAQPSGLTDRLLALEDGEVGRRIGRKLLEDSLMRNIVPVAGLAISARWNYVATRRLGGTVRRYVRYRRALREALRELKLDALAEPEMLVEGAWLLATAEGEPSNETAMAIGLIVAALPEESRRCIGSTRAFGDDEESWFDALDLVPTKMHCALMDVLYLVAAADRELQPGERRFLQRVGRALKIPVDLDRVQRICRHLTLGEQLPQELVCGAR
jgi:hypothetical protein